MFYLIFFPFFNALKYYYYYSFLHFLIFFWNQILDEWLFKIVSIRNIIKKGLEIKNALAKISSKS